MSSSADRLLGDRHDDALDEQRRVAVGDRPGHPEDRSVGTPAASVPPTRRQCCPMSPTRNPNARGRQTTIDPPTMTRKLEKIRPRGDGFVGVDHTVHELEVRLVGEGDQHARGAGDQQAEQREGERGGRTQPDTVGWSTPARVAATWPAGSLDGVAENRSQSLGRAPSRIAQVDLVMATAQTEACLATIAWRCSMDPRSVAYGPRCSSWAVRPSLNGSTRRPDASSGSSLARPAMSALSMSASVASSGHRDEQRPPPERVISAQGGIEVGRLVDGPPESLERPHPRHDTAILEGKPRGCRPCHRAQASAG